MKAFIRAALGLAVAAVTLQGNAAEFTMRISHQLPPSHHTAANLEQFAKEVEAATNQRVDVQIFGASQLFKPNQQHAAVAGGKVEAAAILSFQWGGTIPEMGITAIPYLMTSVEKIKAFMQSDAAKLLDGKMEAKGIKNIGWLVDANDGLFTSAKAPLLKPEDYRGLKIRGLNKMFDTGLQAMGAAPATIPGSEVYQALQTGVLDAGLTGVQAANARKFYEVQKYGVASNLLLVFNNLVVNPAWWNDLPDDVRQAIQKASDAAVARSIPKADGIPAEDLKVLRDKGMQVTELTPEQAKVMAEAMQPAVKEAFTSSAGADGAKLLQIINGL